MGCLEPLWWRDCGQHGQGGLLLQAWTTQGSSLVHLQVEWGEEGGCPPGLDLKRQEKGFYYTEM